MEGPEQNVQHGGGGFRAVVKELPQPLGDRKHELSHRDVGEDVVHHMGSGLGHVAGPARRTGAPSATRKREPDALQRLCTGYNGGSA